MLENYNMALKANETKVIIKRTGQIGTVVGIVDSGCGSYSLRVRVPSRYNEGVHYVSTYDLTDIIFKKENIKHDRPDSDSFSLPNIKAVYFNDPLTCVIWKDGTKTFVKNADGDHNYDPEKALAMAISKKALGNKYNYYKEFEKWLPEDDEKFSVKDLLKASKKASKTFTSFKAVAKECKAKENPVEKAYSALLKVNDDPTSKDSDFAAAIEEAIKYLGEALAY